MDGFFFPEDVSRGRGEIRGSVGRGVEIEGISVR